MKKGGSSPTQNRSLAVPLGLRKVASYIVYCTAILWDMADFILSTRLKVSLSTCCFNALKQIMLDNSATASAAG